MRDVDEIFGHGNGQRRIVFEEGLWCIYEKNGDTGDVYAIHRCEKVGYALDQGGAWECGVTEAYPEESRYGCGETAPDSIKTLYTIHRWKR
jgi:hypothetical protein